MILDLSLWGDSKSKIIAEYSAVSAVIQLVGAVTLDLQLQSHHKSKIIAEY